MAVVDEATGNPLDDSYLRDVIINFFIAGRGVFFVMELIQLPFSCCNLLTLWCCLDTTAVLLTWTLYELSCNPHVEQKVACDKFSDYSFAYNLGLSSMQRSLLRRLNEFLEEMIQLQRSSRRWSTCKMYWMKLSGSILLVSLCYLPTPAYWSSDH